MLKLLIVTLITYLLNDGLYTKYEHSIMSRNIYKCSMMSCHTYTTTRDHVESVGTPSETISVRANEEYGNDEETFRPPQQKIQGEHGKRWRNLPVASVLSINTKVIRANDEGTPSGHPTIFHVIGQHSTWVQGDYRSKPFAPGPQYWTHNQNFSKVDHENLEIRVALPRLKSSLAQRDYDVQQSRDSSDISQPLSYQASLVGVPHIHILQTSRLHHTSTYIHSTTQPDPRRYSTHPIRHLFLAAHYTLAYLTRVKLAMAPKHIAILLPSTSGSVRII